MSRLKLSLDKTLSGHSGAIYDIVPFDHFVYTTSADRYVVRWDLQNATQDTFTVKLEHTAFNLALNESNTKLLIGNSKGGIHVVDVVNKTESKYLTQHKASIFALTYDLVNDVFYSGDGDGYFCAWKADTMKLLITLPLNCGKIRQIKVADDGKHIAICGQDGFLRVLETGFFNEISAIKLNSSGVNCCLFVSDDEIIAGGKDAHLTLLNWKTGKKIKTLPAHNYAVYDLRMINNKKNIVSVSFDKTIKLWSWPELEILQRIEFKDNGHRHTVNRIAQIDEKSIVTVSDDAKIKVWKLA